MNTWTDAEISLCKKLHELNVRPEIREGDWVIEDGMNPGLVGDDAPLYQRTQIGRNRYVLLLTWERCREWLKERGWKLDLHKETYEGHISVVYTCRKTIKEKSGWGQTDLEAILSVMIQIAEEEKA